MFGESQRRTEHLNEVRPAGGDLSVIIHPSSVFLTAELLRWETMRERRAPGLHPKKQKKKSTYTRQT